MAVLQQHDLDSLLQQAGAYHPNGHFQHSEEVHTTTYFEIGKFHGQKQLIRQLTSHVASLFLEERPEVVLSMRGPSTIFTGTLAWQFRQFTGLQVESFRLTESRGHYYPIENEFNLVNKRTLLFVGMCAQPKRIGRLIEAIQGYGGIPVGTAVLCLRAEQPLYNPNPTLKSATTYHLPTQFYTEDICPGCQQNLPLTTFR